MVIIDFGNTASFGVGMQLNYIFELEEFIVLVKSRHIGQICRFNVRNLCAALSLL